MKLVHPDFYCQIELTENRIPVIIFESPNRLLNFISQLKAQMDGYEGEWVLSENGTILDVSKTCELIIDLFSLDMNQKKLTSALYHRLERELLSSELLPEWNSFYSVLSNFTEKVFALSEYHLNYRETLDVRDFLKFMNVSFEDSSEDLLERVIDYMALSSAIVGTSLFILCNAKSFFDDTQLTYLYEQAFYKKFYLLLIESRGLNEKNELEDVIIIDNDDCVIRLNHVK